jgi:type I restriction enzyme S subunit
LLYKSVNLERFGTGSGVPTLNRNDVHNLAVALPPLSEQRSLAQALSDVDTLIAALDKLIAKKRDLKTATMQQLLTGKKRLPGFGEGQGYKESMIGLIPEDWDALRLGDIAPLQRGFDLPTSQLKKGDYPVVYSNGIMNRHSDFMVNCPGVVTGRSGTIGNVHYVSENYWPHNTALWVTEFRCSNPKYVYYLYKSVKLERFGSGSGVPTLNRNDVHDWVVAIPKIEEQRAIATVLSDMDAEITALESRLVKTQAIKQGMMQELLTGRTRLISNHPAENH